MNAKEIIIDKDYYCWNGSRMIYFQCETKRTDSIFHETTRCGGDSEFIITFPIDSGREITRHFCHSCANDFIKDAENKGYAIRRVSK